MTCGVYKIEAPSGKKYIGSSNNIERRWKEHKKLLQAGKHHCEPLQRAFNKYGEAVLHFEVLFECEKSQLIKMEQWCFNWFGKRHLFNASNRLYNASMIAGRIEMTPETLAKRATTVLRKIAVGEPDTSGMHTPKARAKRSATLAYPHCSRKNGSNKTSENCIW